MDEAWASGFRDRMRSFGAAHPYDGLGVSLKARVTSGCFHREHSPHAYALIDAYRASTPPDEVGVEFLEHESGPELLVYLAAGTAGVTLAKSVIDLVVAIITARQKGIAEGDHPSDPIELIVRRVETEDSVVEETVFRIGNRDPVNPSEVEVQLNAAVERLAAEIKQRDT